MHTLNLNPSDRETHLSFTRSYSSVTSLYLSLSNGYIICKDHQNNNEQNRYKILIKRISRDIHANSYRKFVYTLGYDTRDNEMELLNDWGVEISNCVFWEPSPSGRFLCCVKKDPKNDNNAYIIELWDGPALIRRIYSGDFHGKIVSDGWFGGLSWSRDETLVCYLAQRKSNIKKRSFFDGHEYNHDNNNNNNYKEEEKDHTPTINEFLYEEDWGEKYTGVSSLGVYVVNFEQSSMFCAFAGPNEDIYDTDNINNDKLNITPGQPIILPDNKHIVFTGWDNNPRRYGMIYCHQRRCKIYITSIEDQLNNENNENKEEGDKKKEEEKKDNKNKEIEDDLKKHPNNATCLTPHCILARFPRLSRNGDRFVYLSSTEGFDTHNGCMQLSMFNLKHYKKDLLKSNTTTDNSKYSHIVIDTVDTIETLDDFPGIYGTLPVNCWGLNDSYIYINTFWRSALSIIQINLEDGGTVQKLNSFLPDLIPRPSENASTRLLTISKDGKLLVTASSPSFPGAYGIFDPADPLFSIIRGPNLGNLLVSSSNHNIYNHIHENPIHGIPKTPRKSPLHHHNEGKHFFGDEMENNYFSKYLPDFPHYHPGQSLITDLIRTLNWEIINFKSKDDLLFDALLMLPSRMNNDNDDNSFQPLPPLIVVVHGGPHSCFPTSFLAPYSWLCAIHGFGILSINYRGSIGFGETALNRLPGNIGTVEVEDIMQAVNYITKMNPPIIDVNKIGVVGGSHGGFLGSHLIGQYPNIFKTACLRNPVTNISSMVSVTDIPDWCHIEAKGGNFDFSTFRVPTESDLISMYRSSPIRYIDQVRASVLLLIGKEDKRVPQSQGLEYYKALKSRGIKTRLQYYPEDCHALDKPGTEADQWIHIALWLHENLD